MADFNLLPEEFAPQVKYKNLSSRIAKISAIVGTLILLTSLAISGFLYIYKDKLENELSSQDTLKNEIRILKSSEQRLVIIQDRLSKIKNILSSPTSESEFEAVKEISDILQENAQVKSVVASPGEIIIQFKVDSADGIKDLQDSLKSISYVKEFTISNTQFSETDGYSIGVVVKR